MNLLKRKRTALLRVDFNVPIYNNTISDTKRIRAAIPTIELLLRLQFKVVIVSHHGRPKMWNKENSLERIVEPLSRLLGQEVLFFKQSLLGSELEKTHLPSAPIILLENIRFYKEELSNDLKFCEKLSKLGDIYINDAFGVSHRFHSSVSGIHNFFSNKKYRGLLIEKELNELSKIKTSPNQPFTVIVGGSKIASKIIMLSYFLGKADNIIVGGGMAFPFIKALGGKVGGSLCAENEVALASSFIAQSKHVKTNFILPDDAVVADSITNYQFVKTVDIRRIPSDYMGLDIGPKSIEKFGGIIDKSKSLLWNGPMGVFEQKDFSAGTFTIAQKIAERKSKELYSLAGGGDTLSAISTCGIQGGFSYLSTGGGAMLDFFKKTTLPGINSLKSISNLETT